MGELLDGFLAQYDNEEGGISLKDLMTQDELEDWELLVKVFNELEITAIGPNLRKVAKFYKLNRWQEMSVLALVKVFEMMVGNMKGRMGEVEERMKTLDGINEDFNNTNGMFG
tara:strand:- start:111 stop:449 length:339 start_codon:yes stop_codon:yes gene_type:complete